MNFFIGVVEDVNDPAERNRVRVRIFGKHTDDLTLIPTERLPWSNVMMPVTAASVPGVGVSIGLVQGSWVVGMYLDRDQSETVIIGSLPSESTMRAEGTGFSDPERIHPRANGNDTPAVASSNNFETDDVYTKKRGLYIEKIPVARPAECPTLDQSVDKKFFEDLSYNMEKYDEVIQPKYPDNKVYKTEGGHCTEFDDTPNYERISEMHSPSGTYREIVADGSSTTVVTGDNFQIVHKNNNIYIKGNCNITVDGEMRTLVKGDYHFEVEGNHTEKIHGNSHIEIGRSEFKEVVGNTGLNVAENQTILVGGNQTETIVGNSTFTVNKDSNIIVKKDQANITAEHYTITSVKNAKFSCPEKIHINTPVARVSGDCIAGGGGVSLITHNHTQTSGNDLGGGTNTTPSNSGTGVGS